MYVNNFASNYLQTNYTNFTCATCFSLLPNGEELYKHICFKGKTIYSNEGVIYCLSDDQETFIEFDHSDNIISDDTKEQEPEREKDIPLKHITPKKPNKNGKLLLIYLFIILMNDSFPGCFRDLLYKCRDCFINVEMFYKCRNDCF